MTTNKRAAATAMLAGGVIAMMYILPGYGRLLAASLPSAATTNAHDGPAFAVPLYTGTIYPAPREVKYLDEFVPLARVGIVPGQGVAREGGPVAVLRERLERYGAVCQVVAACQGDYDAFICVGEGAIAASLCPGTPPNKPEGYLIAPAKKDGKPVVALKGNDKLGMLWAVTAFNQLVTKQAGRPVARLVRVVDYPDVAGKRSYLAGNDGPALDNTWFAVNCLRPNIVVYRMARQMFGSSHGTWRKDTQTYAKEWKAKIEGIAVTLNPLGIEWYDCILPNFCTDEKDPVKNLQIRSKSDEDFRILLDLAMYCAERGGNFGLLYDDFRFPIHPDDKRDFGSAREADVYFLAKLYNAVRAKHTNFKLLFCPPFYWGPTSPADGWYGEPREDYLKAVGALPAGIEIYWTGPAVRSAEEKPELTRWFTDLTRRKPVFWENTFGILHGDQITHYSTDPVIVWPTWYYDTFFDDLTFYTINNGGFLLNMALNDYLWNRKAYDPAASIAEADKKIVGATAYPKLVEFCAQLAWFDPYGSKPNSAAARNLEEVKKRTAELVEAGKALDAVLPKGAEKWIGYRDGSVGRVNYLKRLLALPNLKELAEADDQIKALALKETQADPASAIVLTPGSFTLKRPARVYGWGKAEGRFVCWINGKKTDGYDKMSVVFMSPGGQAPVTDYELTLCALNHNRQPPCRIKITLNGKVVFEGENPFQPEAWTRHTFKVPAAFFTSQENTFMIANLEDSSNLEGAPWFMFNYAVLRPMK
ncbi:MAG: beta-N-acetylglucosaminidase domain-containing protein [Kiritimatiellae bacterium]|nr:beta-N-acetylglucosaminidase domain-containing protein [Kiritimatiellia bacterium]